LTRIFAILLLNEKTQELRFRFQLGILRSSRSADQSGRGVTGGRAVAAACLVDDVTAIRLHCRHFERAAELRYAGQQNRVIGESTGAREPGYFTEEHSRLLALVLSRIAAELKMRSLYPHYEAGTHSSAAQ